jgi:peptide deformylase
MAVLQIHSYPAPVLKQKAKRVTIIDRSIKKLISDMIETLHAVPGRVGLAAPQVGVSLRVIVIGLPEQDDIVLINPEIVKRKGERIVEEGCLSLPGYFAQITRSEAVTVKGLDADGKEVRIKADGLLAQALEHEIDHLNGTLYFEHLKNMAELQKVQPKETSGTDGTPPDAGDD